MARPADGGQSTAAATWTVKDPQIIGDIVQVDPEGEALIVNSVGGNFEVNTTMYRQASGIVTTGSGTSPLGLPRDHWSAPPKGSLCRLDQYGG